MDSAIRVVVAVRFRVGLVVLLAAASLAWPPAPARAGGGVGAPSPVVGVQRVLVIPVQFADVAPGKTIREIQGKARRIAEWVAQASYGKARVEFRVLDWQRIPERLDLYRVSPHNYEVDRTRVRRLVEAALSLAGRTARLEDFSVFYVVVGAHTMPGSGYGMIAYCANPGMLSGVRRSARLEPLHLQDGRDLAVPVIVSAENAHPGHAAHDLLHALGGARDGRRAVPDLYDFDLQSHPPVGVPMTPALFAIHTGPWDIMSQHFVEVRLPPPPPSSFTRLQLGWIAPSQVVTVQPGQTRTVEIQSLESGRAPLVVKVPLGERRYLLLENRQRTGLGEVLPAEGLLVLEVNEEREEGSDIVRVVNANPGVPGLARAPFLPGQGERRAHVDRAAGVAVVPLAGGPDGTIRALVTTPEEAESRLSSQR